MTQPLSQEVEVHLHAGSVLNFLPQLQQRADAALEVSNCDVYTMIRGFYSRQVCCYSALQASTAAQHAGQHAVLNSWAKATAARKPVLPRIFVGLSYCLRSLCTPSSNHSVAHILTVSTLQLFDPELQSLQGNDPRGCSTLR